MQTQKVIAKALWLLTFFPVVVLTWTWLPLILETSPSTQASFGSSTHTCDPTTIFIGVAAYIRCQAKCCQNCNHAYIENSA